MNMSRRERAGDRAVPTGEAIRWLVNNPDVWINPCGHVCYYGWAIRDVTEAVRPVMLCCRCTNAETRKERPDCPVCGS